MEGEGRRGEEISIPDIFSMKLFDPKTIKIAENFPAKLGYKGQIHILHKPKPKTTLLARDTRGTP